MNQNDFEEYRTEIREYYDEWRQSEVNRTGLALIALITGLSLGLKSSGNDITNAPSKVEKEKTSRHTLIFIGGIVLYIATKNKTYCNE